MKALKIVLLFDLGIDLPVNAYDDHWDTAEWKTERDIRDILIKQGHGVTALGLFNSIEPLLKLVDQEKPDLVFNMVESFRGNRSFEPNIAALLELLGVPFTGAGSKSLQLCKDKGFSKAILDHHGIKTPRFVIAKRSRALPSLKDFTFPAFVKPLELESSEGISQSSYVANEKEALKRLKFIHEHFQVDAIVEEFIDGREIYVSVLGNEKLITFPARELFFKEMSQNDPKFATYKSKWDKNYRKKWGIDTAWAKDLPELTRRRMTEFCKTAYRLLHIQGFGRIDLRIRKNEVFFIEANPNPSIARKEDYALSAARGGVSYEELIAKIVALAVSTGVTATRAAKSTTA